MSRFGTHFRLLLGRALFALVAVLMSGLPAWSQSWNMYSGPNVTVDVGYASTTQYPAGQMTPNNPALINVSLPGGINGVVPTIMDTGSTGIVVGSNNFNPAGLTALGTGSQS